MFFFRRPEYRYKDEKSSENVPPQSQGTAPFQTLIYLVLT